MNPITTPPPAPTGAGPEAVEAPALPPKDKILKVGAYFRSDGWVAVTLYYDDCNIPGGEEEVCIKVRRVYIPAQRAPLKLKPRKYRAWTSEKYIGMWLNALTEYVEDVAKIIEFAAENAPKREVAEALRRFEVRVSPPVGIFLEVGLKVGDKVIPLDVLPEEIYGESTLDTSVWGVWGKVEGELGEIIRSIAFTYMWKAAVEKTTDCRVEYMRGGGALIRCRDKTLEVSNVLPLQEPMEKTLELLGA